MNKILRQRGAASPIQLGGLFLLLVVSWLLWSGIYKPLLLWLGLFSCLLSVWLAKRMGFFHYLPPFRSLRRMPAFCWRLLGEVVTSSIEVAKLVLSPSLPISPTMLELSTAGMSDVGKVILGNSITLSPGTATIDLYEDRLLVHCLTREGALGLLKQDEQQRNSKLDKN